MVGQACGTVMGTRKRDKSSNVVHRPTASFRTKRELRWQTGSVAPTQCHHAPTQRTSDCLMDSRSVIESNCRGMCASYVFMSVSVVEKQHARLPHSSLVETDSPRPSACVAARARNWLPLFVRCLSQRSILTDHKLEPRLRKHFVSYCHQRGRWS